MASQKRDAMHSEDQIRREKASLCNNPLEAGQPLRHLRRVTASETLIELALKNGGSITSSEMQALGVSREWIARRTADGWLERVAHSTYVLPGATSRWKATLSAACHRLGAVVSHESAAQLHGIGGVRPGSLVVTVPVRRSNRFPGVEVRQKTDLAPDQVVTRSGLPVTTPARTLIDLAERLGPRRLGQIVDSAVAERLTTYQAVAELLSLLGRRGKPGVRSMRVVLADRVDSTTPPATVLEARVLEIIELGGLPRPTTQFHAPWLRAVHGRVDFAYEDHRIVIEADSRRWHTLADAFLEDRERDNLAQLAGWRVLRFTWWDVEERADYVASTIKKALNFPNEMQGVTST